MSGNTMTTSTTLDWLSVKCLGVKPAYLLSVSDFKSETSFGFFNKNTRGKLLLFCVKPQNGLVWSVSVLWCVQRGLGPRIDCGPFIGSLYHMCYRTHIMCVILVCAYKS